MSSFDNNNNSDNNSDNNKNHTEQINLDLNRVPKLHDKYIINQSNSKSKDEYKKESIKEILLPEYKNDYSQIMSHWAYFIFIYYNIIHNKPDAFYLLNESNSIIQHSKQTMKILMDHFYKIILQYMENNDIYTNFITTLMYSLLGKETFEYIFKNSNTYYSNEYYSNNKKFPKLNHLYLDIMLSIKSIIDLFLGNGLLTPIFVKYLNKQNINRTLIYDYILSLDKEGYHTINEKIKNKGNNNIKYKKHKISHMFLMTIILICSIVKNIIDDSCYENNAIQQQLLQKKINQTEIKLNFNVNYKIIKGVKKIDIIEINYDPFNKLIRDINIQYSNAKLGINDDNNPFTSYLQNIMDNSSLLLPYNIKEIISGKKEQNNTVRKLILPYVHIYEKSDNILNHNSNIVNIDEQNIREQARYYKKKPLTSKNIKILEETKKHSNNSNYYRKKQRTLKQKIYNTIGFSKRSHKKKIIKNIIDKSSLFKNNPMIKYDNITIEKTGFKLSNYEKNKIKSFINKYEYVNGINTMNKNNIATVFKKYPKINKKKFKKNFNKQYFTKKQFINLLMKNPDKYRIFYNKFKKN